MKKRVIIMMLVMCMIASSAFAITLSTSAEYSYFFQGQTYSGTDSNNASSGTITSSASQGTNTYPFAEYIGGAATASASGDMAVSSQYYSSKTGNDVVHATAAVETTVNAVGSNQTYMYTFNISGGVLAIADYLLMSPLNAAYDISILLDNVVIWHSAAVLSGTKLNYSLTTDGTVLTHHFFKNDQYMPGPGAPNYDYYPQWSFGYTFDPYSGSLNLGQYSLGQSFTLSYVMDVSAFGVGAETGALAAFGDPFSLSGGMSGSIQGGGPSPVAEPGTLLLLGTGLIYLAGIGKRHVR